MAAPSGHNLNDLVKPAWEQFAQRLREEAAHISTAQEAALMLLMCLDKAAPPSIAALFEPGWLSLILKRQRYDGSWMGEPLFVTPTRGEAAAWYSSRSVTTAYCWHALKTYARWRQAHPADPRAFGRGKRSHEGQLESTPAPPGEPPSRLAT
jgi:hypothetical protein